MSWLNDNVAEFQGRLQAAKDANVYPFFRPFKSVGARVRIGDASYINFTSNDYLGLSQDPRVIDRAAAALRHYGTGLGSARMQASADKHMELERRIARWLGYPACVTFTTGYQAMVGIIGTLCDDETLLVLDKLSHACIIDGALLAQGTHPDMEMRMFKHNRADHLRQVLESSDKPHKMVVVEGLYSVDGDTAPLAELVRVCKELGAVIIVDDAHGIGTLGTSGRGVAERDGVLRQVDILYGSFSKSFGGIGGFAVMDDDIALFLKHNARSFAYSASLPVAQIEAALAILDLIESDLSYIQRLDANHRYFRQGLTALGLDLGDSDSHITPIMVKDETKALAMAAYLYHTAGLILIPFISPGVARGKERLRCNVTAAHTEDDMGYALEAIGSVARQFGIIGRRASTGRTVVQRARDYARSRLRAVETAGPGALLQEGVHVGFRALTTAKSWLGLDTDPLAGHRKGGGELPAKQS